MDRTIVISLTGHAEEYRLDEAANASLTRYLDRAGSRLQDDPDRAEILADLERSIGDRLSALPGSEDRVLTATDIDGVLAQIGNVDTGDGARADDAEPAPRRRHLRRIREGQQLAGVCNGLADYAELRVDWVRTGFVLATVVTAGLFGLVYVALAFILPVSATRDARP